MEVYPKAPENKLEIEKLDKNEIAQRIIVELDTGRNRNEFIGDILEGSDDLNTFNQAYREVIQDIYNIGNVKYTKNVESVSTVTRIGEDGKEIEEEATTIDIEPRTEAEYIEEIVAAVTHIDSHVWYAGKLLQEGVSDYAGLIMSSESIPEPLNEKGI